MVLLPTRVSMPAVTNLRNLPFVPGTGFSMTYPVELKAVDVTVGVTLVSATLTVAPAFGQTATLTKTITTASTADGQITDNAATDGLGALHLDITGAECTGWTGRQVFVVTVTDSKGRPTPLDAGYLVPATGHEYDFAPVDRVIIAPTELTVNMGSTGQIAAVAVDEDGVPLTDRVISRTTSDALIATVDSVGIVTATGIGTALITATADGVSASATVMVPVANFSDTFSRADGAIGTAETGQPWIILDGTWVIQSNRLIFQGSGTSDKRAVVIETMRADCTVSVVARTVGFYGARLVARATDIDNYLYADWSGGTLMLVRRAAFVDTTIGTTSYTVAANDTVSIILSGSSITVQVNGVTKIGPVVDTFNASATKHGLGAYDSFAGAFDNFLVVV